jgi:hypothetical protein
VDARATYEQGQTERSREVSALEARARGIGTARLVLAALAVGLVGGLVWGGLGPIGWAAVGVDLALFVALVLMHARVHERKERASAALRFHKRGLARLDHAWDRLPVSGERFRTTEHSFAVDLDVFGHGSLMQLIDATETRFGEEHLAGLLSQTEPAGWPEDALSRQEAVRDLASRPAFREKLAMAGGVLRDDKPDPLPLLAWAEQKGTVPTPLVALAWVLPAGLLALYTVGPWLGLRSGVLTLASIGQIAIGLAVGARLTRMLDAASEREAVVSRWRAMIAALEAEPFEAPRLVALRARLVAGKRTASQEIAALERIVGFADARRNEVFRFLIGPLLMWDVHCARALGRWRVRAGRQVRTWLETLGEMEALASLGGFAHEHPTFAWPTPTEEPRFEAVGLGHPVIANDRRVGNDVHLPSAGRALVVTGSNMSGKSTLLRAVGVNAVLAYAGAPVCATSLRIGPARVATSMRIDDSLEQGVSHFYAELRRLKRVLDLAHEGGRPPVLFLLDEILHGTNSRERVIGACAVVRELLGCGALGAVSTHDLGITALERELGGKVENVHFEEQVHGEEMTFDFILRPGIVQSSNALRLMRAVGIAVGDSA